MTLNKFLKHSPQVVSMHNDTALKFTNCLNSKRPVLIGITGETACGKSMFLDLLQKCVKNSTVIDGDNYYKDISAKILEAGSFSNLCESGYDLESPGSFNLHDLYEDLDNLKKGKTVYIPRYHINGTGIVEPKAQKIEAKPYIFIGGICSFFEPVRDLLDFKIFIETDFEERKQRFMRRAVLERDMSLSEAESQFERVNKSAQKYLIPLVEYADIIIKGDTDIESQREFIQSMMKNAF